MMIRIAQALADFLRTQVTGALAPGTRARVQPELVGPPPAALEQVFALLTSGGDAWYAPTLGGPVAVYTLLVREDAPHSSALQGWVSQHCNWDYAVEIRNSFPACVVLATPTAWDSRHESLVNTAQTFGAQGRGGGAAPFGGEVWLALVGLVADRCAVSTETVIAALSGLHREAHTGGRAEFLPWEVVDEWLAGSSPGDFARASGLVAPSPSAVLDTTELEKSAKVLEELAKFCGANGFEQAGEALAEEARTLAQAGNLGPGVETAVHGLFAHLAQVAGNGPAFEQTPRAYFRSGSNTSWYTDLDRETLGTLLGHAGASTVSGSVRISCENAINGSSLLPGEPFITLTDVQLAASAEPGPVPHFEFERRQTRGFESLGAQGNQYVDTTPPPHTRPLTYRASAPGHKPAQLRVVSLSSFVCAGHARIRGALANPVAVGKPTKNPVSWTQEIEVAGPGIQDLTILGSPSVASARIVVDDIPTTLQWDPQRASTTYSFRMEADDEFEIELLDANDKRVGIWTVSVRVDDPPGEPPRTQFDALVAAQQKPRLAPVLTIPSGVRDLERAYLASPDSWRGLTAYWEPNARPTTQVDWQEGRIGASPAVDPRPADWAAPSRYVLAREAMRDWIGASAIGEAILSDGVPQQLVGEYLDAYLEWLALAPAAAAWADCIAVYAPESNALTSGYAPSGEPAAILISPLHPLKLGWHCYAQRVLQEAFDTEEKCPAAGFIVPTVVPGITAIPLSLGGARTVWRAFLAGGCGEPHWSLMWSSRYLANSEQRDRLIEALDALGFGPSGWSPGFTSGQAKKALEEVRRILAARSTLAVEITGEADGSVGVVEGVVEWCRDHFAPVDGAQVKSLPVLCEVRDLRASPRHPTPDDLANLLSDTRDAVRWFTGEGVGLAPTTRSDLVILDQLGGTDPALIAGDANGSTRSPLGRGALFRINPRTDLAGAQVIEERRVGRQEHSIAGLAGILPGVVSAMEALALRADQVSTFQFRPNQVALANGLNSASFAAVSSTQVDPACFVRGARAADGYLWDYELPGGSAKGERAGYYLVAKPNPSMHDAIATTANLIGGGEMDTGALLDEISRRGIPVLRRITLGGSQARGELGVLLAARWLQDVFRSERGPVRLPVVAGECVHFLLPVDSYWAALALYGALGTGSGEHPDILVFSICVPADGTPVQITATPVEVKFREGGISRSELVAARKQATNLGSLLDQLWEQPARNDLWAACGQAFLAQCLDQCFRIYADQSVHGTDPGAWEALHERVLHDVLGEAARVTVNALGLVIAIGGPSVSYLERTQQGGRYDALVIGSADARELMVGNGEVDVGIDGAETALGLRCRCLNVGPGDLSPDQNPAATPPASAAVRNPTVVDELPIAEAVEAAGGGTEEESGLVQDAASAATKSTGIPMDVRARVQSAFVGFVGNSPAVKRISNDLLAALVEDPPHLSKNYLFTGQPSTGKTELARRLASALGLPLVKLDGQGLTSRERLMELVHAELRQAGLKAVAVGQEQERPVLRYPPLMVFIDEVHLVSRSVQEGLLTVLEASDRTLPLQAEVARMDLVTFAFATTRSSGIDSAFRTRCVEVPLREYSNEQVADIVKSRFPHPEWTRAVYEGIARLGRRVPRIALELARDLETEIKVTETPGLTTEEYLDEVRRAREIDELGLGVADWDYLEMLERQGPVGEASIVKMLGTVDRNRVSQEVEPFLMRLGFIVFGRGGREITAEGRRYLRTADRPGTSA